jgi:CheY-like chemotaxis protein
MFKKLLLIEDDEDDRDFFLEVIGETFPDKVCTTASNGREALDKLLRNEFQPDLIFLDLNMPLMSGKQFLAELKNHEELMKIPVVILSTSSDSKSIMETKALGAKHFITKPDKITILETKLREFFTNPSL